MVKVSAAIVTHNSKILLFLRDNKPTINDPNCWSLIGGHVEEGETHEDGLIRELEEEIGIRIKKYKKVLEIIGAWGEETFLYYVPLASQEVSFLKKGEDEGQKIEFFSLEEIKNLPLSTNLKFFLTKHRSLFEKAVKQSEI